MRVLILDSCHFFDNSGGKGIFLLLFQTLCSRRKTGISPEWFPQFIGSCDCSDRGIMHKEVVRS